MQGTVYVIGLITQMEHTFLFVGYICLAIAQLVKLLAAPTPAHSWVQKVQCLKRGIDKINLGFYPSGVR